MSAVISIAEIIGFRRSFPSLPVIPYTSMSASAMRAIAELAPHGISRVILHRVDDSPQRLLDMLRARPTDAITPRVLELLDPELSRLTQRVRAGVLRLFDEPQAFYGVADLARAAGVNARTLYRQFESAGLAPARSMVLGARLLRAYVWLRDPANSAQDVVRKLGFSSRQQFGRQLTRATGASPRVVRSLASDDLIVDRLVALMRAPPGGLVADAPPGLAEN
ncbi:MAG: helix-turn-helix domain-containing protein [Gemmatimonadetes bacterium]|nr:helix-turn-helix domain-containing protein [Gemmatimonadota bacterium]